SWLMPGENLDFSEDVLVATSGYDSNYAPFPASYDWGGNYVMSIAQMARWSGPADEPDAPYPSGPGLPPPCIPQKHLQQMLVFPPRASALDNLNIKGAVTSLGGVYTHMYWNGAYFDDGYDAYYYDGSQGINHAVAIIGWDDAFDRDNFAGSDSGLPPGDGAFLVKNSWGASFGDEGYFWASYYDSNFDVAVVFSSAEDTANYNRNYQYDPLGNTLNLGYGREYAWMANVFTVYYGEALELAAVSFYANAPGTTYQVYVNPNFSGADYRGALRESGALAVAGYYTVPLDPIVTAPVVPGQRFSVAVRLSTPGYTYPLPIEFPSEAVGSSHATASPGQSFISSDGIVWEDLTSQTDFDPAMANSNVCLKAFTQRPATLSLQRPNGGETLDSDLPTNILWNSSGISDNLKVEVNRDYPNLPWESLWITPAATGSAAWTPGLTPSSHYRIRLSSLNNGHLTDKSSRDFTISRAISLQLLGPNGGEEWITGQNREITWTSTHAGSLVRVELTRSYPEGPWETLFAATANDGEAQWTVTGSPSSRCRVRVSSASEPAALDTSSANFRILSDETWVLANLHEWGVESLASPPGAPLTIFAGTNDGGVFRSLNGGEKWGQLNKGLNCLRVLSLAAGSGVTAFLFAGTATGGVYRSANGGENWSPANTGFSFADLTINALAVSGGKGNVVLAGTRTGGVYRSSDSGAHWMASNSGMSSLNVHALLAEPGPSNRVYAGTSSGFYGSIDGGQQWTLTTAGLQGVEVWSLAIAPHDPSRLFAGAANGVFRSNDGGASWNRTSTGLHPGTVRTLLVSPANPDLALAGVEGEGIYQTIDGGLIWAPLNSGLTDLRPHALLAKEASPATFFTGTASAGLFRYIRACSLTLLEPAGEERWVIGTPGTISWTWSGVISNVMVELSRTSGESWETLFSSTTNDGSATWTITGPASGNCRMRVSSLANPAVAGVSQSDFTISPSPTLQLLTPHGGESWTCGSTQNITWTSSHLWGAVSIELNRDYPSGPWEPLFPSTADDWAVTWTVTGPSTLHARMRVSSLAWPFASSVSMSDFAIIIDETSYTLALLKEWNLVAMSVVSEASPTLIFGPNLLAIYLWDPSKANYIVPANLTPGYGYWVRLRAAAAVTFTGQAL
ncbi:MAG: lectin like domain-containing protein, partial [bacterium]